MKKKSILRQAHDFRVVFAQGRKIESPLFRMYVRKNTFPYARFGFVTPRSIGKKATLRNRIRRRAREWIRKQTILTDQNIDVVLFFKKPAITASRQTFYDELKEKCGSFLPPVSTLQS